MHDENTISLKEHINTKFAELEKQLALRDRLTEKAVVKAEETLNLRLQGMNEFRAELTKQAQNFVKQAEFNLHLEKLEAKINFLTKMVYIGIGILLVLQIVWKYLK